MADSKCSPELALAWALNAKNNLQNVAGFSPAFNFLVIIHPF